MGGPPIYPIVLPLLFLFVPAIVAVIVGGLAAGPILEMLARLKSKQTVSKFVPEHAAKQGTPTMGGIIVCVGFLAGIAYTWYQLHSQPGMEDLKYYGAIAALFLGFTAIGFTDDFLVPRAIKGKRGLGWMQKLVLQTIAAVMFVGFLGRSLSLPHEIAGVFLILFFSNAYNFSDGLDGLAGGILLTLVVGLTIAANARLESGLFPILGALAGGIIPFLWLNVPPARVFMGDVGSLPIGAVLGAVVATLSMPSWTVGLLHREAAPLGSGAELGVATGSLPPISSLGVPPSMTLYLGLIVISGVMLVELVPVPLQILSVKLRKKKLFPFTPIHHSFQRAGWPEARVTAMFVISQLVLSMIGGAIVWTTKPPLGPDAPRRTIHRRPTTAPGHQPAPKYTPDLPDIKSTHPPQSHG
jgi:phospho-N-acetylmuramoyl-pentapeptide-transferase